jgi:hypothetical protein
MNHYRERLNKNQRLAALKALDAMPGYTANDSILHTALDSYGHNLSRDLLRTHLQWLTEQGLITLETIASTHVATLTQRGVDVALGRTHVPGVKRPDPRG